MAKNSENEGAVRLHPNMKIKLGSMDDRSLYELVLPGSGAALADHFPSARSLLAVEASELIAAGLTAKQTQMLLGAWEIFRRARSEPPRQIVTSPDDAASHLITMLSDSSQERVALLSLDTAHAPISARVVFSGGLDRSLIDPKILFGSLLRERAAAFVVAHNHPSGSLDPSRHDVSVTERLRACADMLDIVLLDHLIVAGDRWVSMRELDCFPGSPSSSARYLAS